MKSEHQKNKTASEKLLQKIVQERKFPKLTEEKEKLKTKPIRTRLLLS